MNKQEFIEGVNAEFSKMRDEYVDLGNRFEVPFKSKVFLEQPAASRCKPEKLKKQLYSQAITDAARLIFESVPSEGENKILSADQFFESINNESVDKEEVTDASGVKVVYYKNMGFTCVSDDFAGQHRNLKAIHLEGVKDFDFKTNYDEEKGYMFEGSGVMVASY